MSKPKHGTGLLLPSRESLLWGDSDLAFVVEAARRAEAAGYDSVWAGDSLLARPRGEPLTLLAAVAGATARVMRNMGLSDLVLVAPVGGGDALAPAAATKLVNTLSPAIVVPVRYRSAASPGSGEYEPVDHFAKEMGLAEGTYQVLPKLNLNGAISGSDESRVVILDPRGTG